MKIIILMFLLIVGELCLALARWVISQNNPGKTGIGSKFQRY